MIIALVMEAAGTSKSSVNFYQATWCYKPEDSHLQDKTVDISSTFIFRIGYES
jgi:hypothetical protein